MARRGGTPPIYKEGAMPTRKDDERETRRHIETLRRKVDHPIVDGDGHLLESGPMLLDTVARDPQGGGDHRACQRQHREFTGTTTNINYH